jgi:hypothetical protein
MIAHTGVDIELGTILLGFEPASLRRRERQIDRAIFWR